MYDRHMSQTPITIKIDTDVKHQAQALAKSLGLSVSAIIENQLKTVIRERRVVFEEPLTPNSNTKQTLAAIEADVIANKNLSDAFKTVDELEKYLHTLGHAD
jgi:addiction module RelB/DinJ family antitoxin